MKPSPTVDGAAVPPLNARIPADPGDTDAVLEAFLSWVSDREIGLYEAQEEAILELMAGHHVVLGTPTGSGKSLVALALHFLALCTGRRAYYTSPIKALASEKFFDLCAALGPENVGMLTGDASVNRDAPIICCTAEILANIALREGADADVDFVVMDEFHYYSDRDRGMAWQVPLLILERARFLLMSATLGDTGAIAKALEERTGVEVAVVASQDRPVPLRFAYVDDPLHETVRSLIGADRAPIYQVNFTQRACGEQAQALTSVDLCTREEKKALAEAMTGVRFASPYGKTIRRYLRHGVGLHHAGLLPRYRRLVERLAQKGLLKVICGTDTLGVGVNVPIRTVLFTRLCKYDGEKVDILSARDFHQIAGRAGRAGFDTEGHVVSQAPAHVIENRRLAAKAAMTSGRGKKFVRKKPPERGYKHWDEATFTRLRATAPEPLTSTFRVDHGLLLAFMQRGDDGGRGYRDLMTLIDRCHDHKGRKTRHRRRCRALFGDLMRAQILRLETEPSSRGPRVGVSDTLQEDFSLHHSLSLFLVDALGRLDDADPAHPLQLLSLVESILENPRAVLARQLSRDKGALIAELKAAGVPYEERMERLEDLSWPKPMAEWIYGVLDAFSEQHPWVSTEHVRPKGIAREMAEACWGFDDYVKDLGLEPIEGVLLRYLGSVYRTLRQNVPEAFKTEAVADLEAYLRATVTQADASIVGEWERLTQAHRSLDGPAGIEDRPVDISADPRAFSARVRAELHALVRALSRRDWEGAAHAVCSGGTTPWGSADFEGALTPFMDQHDAVAFNHEARLADKTSLRKVAPHQWEISQQLLTAEGESGWAIAARVDLRSDTNPSGPIITIDRIDG